MSDLRKTALALGCFDGVHLGHQALLRRTAKEADERGLLPAAWLLSGKPSAEGERLCGDEARERLLLECGAERIFSGEFTEIRGLSCRRFVEEQLCCRMTAGLVLCGEDFRFGRDRAGDAATLRALLAERGIGCIVLPSLCPDGAPVSSSRIRALLRSGECEQAAALLGRPFFIESEAIPGRGEGRALGFATANQRLPEGMLSPKTGVYLSRVTLPDGRACPALTNFGRHPTFGEAPAPVFESHIPGYTGGPLYGSRLKLELLRYLREERTFPTADDLRAQIAEDLRSIFIS